MKTTILLWKIFMSVCVCIQKYLLASMILEVLCHVKKDQQIWTPLILDETKQRNNTPL